jgi:hypothetical protein
MFGFVVFGWLGALGEWKAHRYAGDTRRPDHNTKAMIIAVPTTMLMVAVAASPVTSMLVSVIGGGVLISPNLWPALLAGGVQKRCGAIKFGCPCTAFAWHRRSSSGLRPYLC